MRLSCCQSRSFELTFDSSDGLARTISDHCPPASGSISSGSSAISLGKRRTSEISEESESGSNRPAKIRKLKATSKPPIASIEYRPHIIVSRHLAFIRAAVDFIQTYSLLTQQRFTIDIPYGVSFELARLVSLNKIQYEDITTIGLNSLRGSNAQNAAETARTFVHAGTGPDIIQELAFAQENAAKVCLFLA